MVELRKLPFKGGSTRECTSLRLFQILRVDRRFVDDASNGAGRQVKARPCEAIGDLVLAE
jgi:hypothetical protein